MMIIGCDLHTRYQQIAMLDTETGELVERRLEHESGEARAFYAGGWPIPSPQIKRVPCPSRVHCERAGLLADIAAGHRIQAKLLTPTRRALLRL
jgi:hypothetical protein